MNPNHPATAKVGEDISSPAHAFDGGDPSIHHAIVKCRSAAIVGWIWAAIGVIGNLAPQFSARTMDEIIDVSIGAIVISVLAFGVYRCSRVSAMALMACLIFVRVAAPLFLLTPFGIILTALLLIFFWLGIRGAFQYRRLLRRKIEVESSV